MRLLVVALLAVLFLVIPAAARASLVDEQQQGQALVAQLQAGIKTCSDLSAEDLDHVGEYVMFRAMGSTSLHQAMNDRMTLMLGEQGESRMHQPLGARYSGCSGSAPATAGYGSMMSSEMMGGYYRSGGWRAMMGSRDWSWMMGGAWREMTRRDWRGLQQRLLRTGSTGGGSSLSTWAIIGLVLGGVVLLGLAVAAVTRGSSRHAPGSAAGR